MNTRETRRAEIARKAQHVREWMRTQQLAAVCLTGRANFAWLTAGGLNYINAASETGVATLVVTADRLICLANRIESPRMRDEELAGLGIEVAEFEWYDGTSAERAFAKHLPTPAATDTMLGGLPAGTIPLDGSFADLRRLLSPAELDRYREVGRLAVHVMHDVCRSPAFVPGISEMQLAGMLADATFDAGARPWVVLIASDERIQNYRHPIPIAKPIDKTAMLVLCAEQYGLIVSLTRIVRFDKLPDELFDRHHACCRVDATFIGASVPGRTLGEVFRDALTAYAHEGFPDEWQKHHQGGLAGYLPREAVATPTSTVQLPAAAGYAWNPSITGTKSEDTILATPGGQEVITDDPTWPTVEVLANGQPFRRPAILER